MAKFDKVAVLKKIGDTGMVPVFYNKDLEVCKNVVKACYEGGVRAFEFTNRGDFAQEVFGELVKWADKECPELALGIGSVVDAPTAGMYIQLGACFVVGPLFNPDRCLRSQYGERPEGTYALVENHGDGRCGPRRGESEGMVQGRCLLRGYGLEAVPKR